MLGVRRALGRDELANPSWFTPPGRISVKTATVRAIEVVAKLGRSRFVRPISGKKPAQGIASVCGTFFLGRVFGGSARASMRRPCDVRRHACTVPPPPCAVATITTVLPPWCGCCLHPATPAPTQRPDHGTPRANTPNGLLHHGHTVHECSVRVQRPNGRRMRRPYDGLGRGVTKDARGRDATGGACGRE